MIKPALLTLSVSCLAACAQMSATTDLSGDALSSAAALPVPNDPWYAAGQTALEQRKAVTAIEGRAKNVILFIGDGMDLTTVTAARIFDGQSRGEDGEANILSFERFPYVALSKTYTTDRQVADSGGSMSAIVTGVKTKSGVLSVTDAATRGDCKSALANPSATLGELAKQAGLSVGVVSTAEITHATPGAVYAHSADRGWDVDSAMPAEAKAEGCKDIARQLIDFPYGNGIDLALGGGRAHFLPEAATDPEDDSANGLRADGADLTAEWSALSPRHVYVWNADQLEAAPKDAKVLGLFERGHMKFEADRADDAGGEPSLADMTQQAVERLAATGAGYFLMVESARIDHAHHGGNAYRALKDTQEFAEAVAAARAMTSDQETLIIVTADHGHTMIFQGYAAKGSDILGLAGTAQGDGKAFTTLAYAAGPGSVFFEDLSEGRPDPTQEEATGKDYRQQALTPMRSGPHGGQDVAIYASGPQAHLIGGVVEQNYIFHVIEYALDLHQRAQSGRR